jgi:agmatinase
VLRFHHSNADTLKDADIVIIGVPDESRSHSKRKSTSRAPDVLRIASNECELFERGGKLIPTCPMRGTFDGKRMFDAGNIYDKQKLYHLVSDISSYGKFPIVIGGDHSLTTEVLKAISSAVGSKLTLLYFDAHPDFISSARNYYGSILADSEQVLDLCKSILIGTRAAEPEELENAIRSNLQIINPLDIVEQGLQKVLEKIKSRIQGSKVYISIDLDCLDPAFAPGVSVPSPGGLTGIELLCLLKAIISGGGVVGLDIVELSPDYDIHGMTASLAARILSECIASLSL